MTRTDRERGLGAWGLNESISAAIYQVFPFSREATVLLPFSVSTGLYRSMVAEETSAAVPQPRERQHQGRRCSAPGLASY